MAAGKIIQGVRWLQDAAGQLVGYRNPITDKDEEVNLAEIQALVSGAGNSPFSIGVGLFGDSITNNGFYTTGASPDGSMPSAFWVAGATENYSLGQGWGSWLGPLSFERIRLVRSWARQTNGLLIAGSSPTGYPLSVQVTQALASAEWASIDRAIVMIGTNDTASTIDACAAELLKQIARIAKPVTLLAAPPRSGTVTTVVGGGLAHWAWLQQWRAVCRRIADASSGRVAFVDGYRPVCSPSASPDVMASGYLLADTANLHPNNAGQYLIADAIVKSILPNGIEGDLDIWPNNSSAVDTNAAGLDQGVRNPLMVVGSGGTLSGFSGGTAATDTPQYYTTTKIGTPTSSVASLVSSPYGGFGQHVEIQSAADGDGYTVASASFHAAGGAFLSAGDVAWAQCIVTLDAESVYPKNITMRLNGFVNPTHYYAWALCNATAFPEVALPLTGARSFLLRTPPMLVPAGVAFTSLIARAGVYYAGAAGAACGSTVSNMECRRFRPGGVYA
jgi:lysophospholipase L1-like esterase